MKPAISWPGGKRRLAHLIISKLPPHHCYVEPFAGGLAVLLAKEPSKVEIVNDLNRDLVNFYRCVRFHRDELLRELEFVPNSREEFCDFIRQPGLTDIQRAARWFIRNKISFGAKGESYGTSKKSGGAANGSRARRLAIIEELNRRLDSVNIEHLDWRDVIRLYDSSETCFYFDPPYTAGHQYRGLRWRREDHVELRDRILQLQGKWVLSYDDSELVRELYAGMQLQEVSRANGIGNNRGQLGRRYRELIIWPE